MTAQVAADLRAAADVLERDGWTQGDYHDDTKTQAVCHCVQGALAVALTGDPWAVPLGPSTDFRRWMAANRQLEKELDGWASDAWNDMDDREAHQVIAALRAAADKADQS